MLRKWSSRPTAGIEAKTRASVLASGAATPAHAGSGRQFRKLHRTIVILLTLILLPTSMVLSAGAAANASIVPTGYAYASPGSFDCDYGDGRQVRVYMPQMGSVSGKLETVYFRPDLYRWGGPTVGWYLYDQWKPWYNAAANMFGVIATPMGKWFLPTGFQALRVQFPQLPAGNYTIKHHFAWSNGARSDSWATTSCYLP